MFHRVTDWLARQILSLPHQGTAPVSPYPLSARNAARLARKH